MCVVVLRSDVRAQQPQGMALPCRLYLLLRVRISMAARETLHPYRWLLGDPTVRDGRRALVCTLYAARGQPCTEAGEWNEVA